MSSFCWERGQKALTLPKRNVSSLWLVQWPHPLLTGFLPSLQLPWSGRCQDRPIYVRMTKFMLSPILFLPLKCRSPQKPSSILSDCTWSDNSLLKLKTKFEYKGGCGRHWCFSPKFPILLWAWWGLLFPTFLRLDVTLWLALTNDL